MTWPGYGEFLLFAVALILVPGPDFLVVTRNTLAGGRRRGRWAALGVACGAFLQGTAAACGLGALVVTAQPVFEGVKWAGVAYLTFLGAQAIRSAVRGDYPPLAGGGPAQGRAFTGWRQGFVCNVTNPKVLVFYLAVLPQFLTPGAAPGWLLAFAWTHAALSLGYLLALSAGLHGVRGLLARRAVRRGLDVTTAAVLIGFGARLATEHA